MSSIFFEKQKICFIHIPKNAGSSVLSWAGQNLPNTFKFDETLHANIKTMKQKYDVHDYFYIIRNPWDRVVSGYHYVRGAKLFWKENGWYEDTFMSFNQFVEMSWKFFDEKQNQTWFYSMTPQIEWIDDSGIQLKCENLSQDFKQVQDLFCCYEELGVVNFSDRLPGYRQYYNQKTKKIVSDIFQEDIDTFKYTF
jgi:hypothetical protein